MGITRVVPADGHLHAAWIWPGTRLESTSCALVINVEAAFPRSPGKRSAPGGRSPCPGAVLGYSYRSPHMEPLFRWKWSFTGVARETTAVILTKAPGAAVGLTRATARAR